MLPTSKEFILIPLFYVNSFLNIELNGAVGVIHVNICSEWLVFSGGNEYQMLKGAEGELSGL